VRDALRGLTLRGRCFLAAGAAAALSAVILGEKDLLRPAVLLVLLPVIAAAALARTRYRLACSRTLEPERVQVGSPTRVLLRLENLSRLPTGVLMLEDAVPHTLGRRPRFVLERLRSRRASSVAYSVRSDVRGRYTLGPLSVRLTDPFGLVELTRSFASTDLLTVTPVVTPLPPVRVGGEWGGSGDSRHRSVAVHGEDDAATREYRHGDDLRKVHWRSTARTGSLMVRREEQPWQSRAAVLLDSRAPAHHGEGPRSSFEWAVGAAASIAVHLGRAGYTLRLVTEAGPAVDTGAVSGEGVLLDRLAEVRASRSARLGPAVEHLRRSGGGEGLVVAVLGELDPVEAELLAGLRNRGTTCIAVLLDTAGWARAEPGPPDQRFRRSASTLVQGGWRVLEAGPDARLDTLWPSAAGRLDLPRPAAARAAGSPSQAAGAAAGGLR